MSRDRVYASSLIVALVLAACFASTVSGQELEMAASPSPVGSGARAAGMADAFVAIADDATAASWNPAGLIQLEEPEISFVGSYNGVFEELFAEDHDEVDSKHDVCSFDLNYLSFVYPVPSTFLGRNAAVSLNYQRKYDFSRKFSLKHHWSDTHTSGRVLDDYTRTDFEQKGGLSTITPAFAIEITDRASIGVALNLWRSSFLSENGWEQITRRNGMSKSGDAISFTAKETREKYWDFTGENVTLGILWNVTDKWSLGARYDSTFAGKVKYKFSEFGTQFDNATNRSALFCTPRNRERRHVRFPSSFAVGAAYRANDRLTLSLDVTRTDDWKDFYVKDAAGKRTSLIDASPLNDPDDPRRHFDPTHTVRFGAEYVFIPDQPDERFDYLWTVRGGMFYDQEPATRHPDDFCGFALGCGLLAHQRVNIDLAYQLRYGHHVNHDFIRGVDGFREDVFQHRVLFSTVVYF